MNATTQGARAVNPGSPAAVHDFRCDKHDAQRDRRLDGGPGTCTQPSVAATSVMLCATVKAVMVAKIRLPPRTINSNASTNNR